jgi:hypothetical protein
MYTRLTKRYEGRFPVDVGGLTFYGIGPKEVGDELGRRIIALNRGFVGECDAEGVLVDPTLDIVSVKDIVAKKPTKAEMMNAAKAVKAAIEMLRPPDADPAPALTDESESLEGYEVPDDIVIEDEPTRKRKK